MKRGVKQAKWMRGVDLELTREQIKKLEWEVSELEAKLKTLAGKKDQEKAAQAKSSREQAIAIGRQQEAMLLNQIANDERKLTFLKYI